MPGDYSRETFDRKKHYSGVRMQQGRVQLDADWNEQLAIHRHRTVSEALDVIGACGVPQATDGFKIDITPDGTDLTISSGRIYVDGLLCELEATLASILKFVQNHPKQVVLQTLIVDGRSFQVGQWVEIVADDKPNTILLQIVDVDPKQNILTLHDDITEFQHSVAPKVRRITTYMTQPDFPHPDPLSPLASPLSDGTYVVFLDVWQRDITALDDPHIREVALGGPDTTTRLKNIWQVQLLHVLTGVTSPPTSLLNDEVTCHSQFAEWDQRTAPSTGMLNARTTIPSAKKDPCLLPPSSGYRRLENQLYRVEVHTGGAHDQATFKWSRDSVETTVERIDGNTVTVTDIGKDEVLGFAAAQWVEIVDEESELKGTPHPLFQIESIKPETREITLVQSAAAFENQPYLKLRRWDQTDLGATTDGIKMVQGWIDLEDGVQVFLSEGYYHSGDYWLIPARTATGEIEWPPFEVPNEQPIPQMPFGICHHYSRLALLKVQAGVFSLMDCRVTFPPLTEITGFFYVGGGGQEAMPGDRLPCPLQVAVMNGKLPVVGAQVHFVISAVDGGILHSGVQSDIALVVETDAQGIAQCDWQLGKAGVEEGRRCLQVEARRIDSTGILADPPIRFNASLSVASKEPGIGILEILSIADQTKVLNDVLVPVSRLAKGLTIVCEKSLAKESFGGAPLDPTSDLPPQNVPAKPTCFITLDLPYPLGLDRNFWDFEQVIGFQPLILGSVVSVKETDILWIPTDAARDWLENILFQRLGSIRVDRVLVHLSLKGNFIWERNRELEVYLDGEAFGQPDTTGTGRVDLRFPSGDGRRGGDFEMWFWLIPPGIVIEVDPPNPTVGGIRGTIRNSLREPLSGVAVTLTDPDGNITTGGITGDDGRFFVSLQVSPGTTYLIKASRNGETAELIFTV